MTLRFHLVAALALFLFCLSPSRAAAELVHEVDLMGAGEVWLHPELGGHGVFLASYELEGLPRGAVFGAELNTDTLRTWVSGLRAGPLELSAVLEGEAALAGLLSDYYRQGRRDPARGFSASFVRAEIAAKLALRRDQYLELALGGRRWIFGRSDETAEALVMPPEAWVFEPRLRYTIWRLQSDPFWRDRRVLFPRVLGFAMGVEVGVDLRSETTAWGARDETAFRPNDLSNDPERASLQLVQWLRAGLPMGPHARSQFFQTSGSCSGCDDLSRPRLGGMTPYVVPLAGAPWAAYLPRAFAAFEWSLHLSISGPDGPLELGVLVDAAWIDDAGRTGKSGGAFALGEAVFADLRLGEFQLYVRVGHNELPRWSGRSDQLSALLALGWQWRSAE